MKKIIKAQELDRVFDKDEADVLEHFETQNIVKRVNVDFPIELLEDIDLLAKKRGVTRQSLLKIWIYDKVQLEKMD